MIAILAADIRPLARLAPPALDALTKKISPERREKINRYLQREGALRCLAAGLLLALALGERPISRDERGKPFVPGGPHFSLAHSGDWALLAVGGAPLGVDVERRRGENFAALARVCFHSREQAWFEREPTEKNFFDLWALKESYLKMLGTGLFTEPASFHIAPSHNAATLEGRADVFFRLYDDLEDHSAALCATTPDLPENIERVDAIACLR